jgi:RiboL-PSP-HEPN
MRAELARFLRGVDLAKHELAPMEAIIDATRVTIEDSHEASAIRDTLRRLQDVAPQVTDLQRSAYSRAIVALYGLLEQFVEGLARDAAERLAQIALSYEDLPDALVRHHTPLTLDVLNGISSGRYNGDLVERDLVAGLQHVLEKFSPVRINAGVYSSHTANVRADTIRQMFDRLGVSLASLQTDPGLVSAMGRSFPGEGNMFFVLDDLAQRRNEVAHGADYALLSFEILRAYVDVCAEYAKALTEQVVSSLVYSAVRLRGSELGRPDNVFKAGSVAGFMRLRETVENGDVLGIIFGPSNAKCVSVAEVQVDKAPVEVGLKGTAAGLRLPVRISARNRLFLLPRDFSYLVLPAR